MAVFWPVHNDEFILFDDGQYVFENPHVATGLNWSNLVWAATQFHSGNWHPITWISHMLDVQFFGMRPEMHHLTNVLFHAANSILLFLLFNFMTGALWRSAIVGGLFALHPAHVESVAWVAERKDVLSAFFFMLTLMAYVVFARQTESRKRRLYYGISIVCFALGLMSKPMLVTLPLILLLIDAWPLQRFQLSAFNFRLPNPRFLLEKTPFFALTIASCIITFLAQKAEGAVDTFQRVPFATRLSNAVIAYSDYLLKLVWPSKLAILYLRPEHWPGVRIAWAIILVAALTLLFALGSRRWPWMAVGWFWFLGMLVPVIGLVQVGNQYMADRYTYLPFIGCFVLLVWGAWELVKSSRLRRAATISATFVLLVTAATLTHHQILYWKNSETLFSRCIAVTSDNFSAHNILGVAMARQNRFDEAKFHFGEALRIQPHYVDALQNFGILLTEHGNFADAVTYLRQAAEIRPESAVLFSRLGFALDMKGLVEQAILYYHECLRLRPDQEDVCNNLAWLLATHSDARIRDGAEAVRLSEHACEITKYQNAPIIGTLAAAYAEVGRFNDATQTAEKAVAVATATGELELAERNKQLLEVYRAGKPHHEPHP